MADHSLTLGALVLTDSAPADQEYVFNVLADGAGFGVAPTVQDVVTSLLADGEKARITRYGNREVTFQVEITGPNLASLARGEAALRGEVGRGNILVWQPPDLLAAPTAFVVIVSSMAAKFDDLAELNQRRVFELSLTCEPFGQSVDPVTIPAISVPSTASSTTVDTCDSATGWTAAINATPAHVSTSWEPGAVSVIVSGASTRSALILTRTGSISFSTQRYLVIEVGYNANLGSVPIVAYGGANQKAPELGKISQQQIENGWYRCVYDTGGATLSAVTFAGYFTAADADLKIRNVSKRNQPGDLTRQQSRIIAPGGTERTPASIHVQSANGTDALGLTIVHTCPDDGSGYSPPLQRWRTVGQTRTTDATAYSGNYELINVTSWVAEVPTAALPTGAYTLLARLRCQTASTVRVSYSTSTIFPDTTTQQGFTLGQVDWSFAAANVWELVPLAVLSLPSVRTSAGKVQIALQVEASTPAVTLDEAWLFRVDDDCALTIVDSARPHLWLDSPNSSSLVPRVSIGNGMTSQVHPGSGLKAMGAHVLSQPGTAVFTAALTDFAKTDATFYRRFHTNATE